MIEAEPESLSIECLQSAEAFEQLRAIWQTLERLDTRCTPFNTWTWNHLWWQHQAGARDTLTLLVVREGRRVVAIAPFYLQAAHLCRVIPTRVLRFVGTGGAVSSNYLDLIAIANRRDAAERRVMQYLKHMKGWQKLQLDDVDEEASLARRAAELARQLPGSRFKPHYQTNRKVLIPDTIDDYHTQLGAARNGQIEQWLTQLDMAGQWEMVLCASNEEMLQASDALFELNRHRQDHGQDAGALCQRADEEFHRAVIRRFFADDALWLAAMKLDGKIIGVFCAFLWRGELLLVHGDYAAEHENLNPLAVLSTHVMKRAIEQGLTRLDMLGMGDAAVFTDAAVECRTVDIACIRPGIRALLVAFRDRLAR